MAEELTAILHSSSMNADPEEEYHTFESLKEAMSADGYSKAYMEINPDSYEVRDIKRGLTSKFQNYSVQVFLRDKGRSVMILVTARKKEHNIERNLKENLEGYIRDNYLRQGVPKSASRPISSREF